MRYECLTCGFRCDAMRSMVLHSDDMGHGDCYDYDLEYTHIVGSWDNFRVVEDSLMLAPRGS